ncbi:MAG: DUF92 domain-containing protein [Methanomicrobiaceae archaeon]|nr:DUF92 domain-containing protein [Methanomicrobiaceae archaeon]MDD5420323.1 DUF92 domain-containing protein [Methanomicrobiaceae archaeon]
MTNLPVKALASILTVICIALAPFIQPAWLFSLAVIIFSLVLYLIPETKYLSISIMVIAVLYGVGLLSIFVFAGTLAIVVMGELAFRATGGRQRSYLYYIVAAAAVSLPVMLYYEYTAPLIVILGILVAVMLRSALREREDTLMVEALGVAMTMYFFEEIGFSVDLMLLFAAAAIAFSFGYFSYRFRAADLSGLFSGALIGIILIVFADVRWFLIMLAFFIIGSACTRYRYDYKASIGVAESHGGVRGYVNVFANGLVSTAAAILYGVTGNPACVALFLGSVASAAADTAASEVGVTGRAPYLITSLKPVAPGTNGGVTPRGEVAAIGAATLVAVVAAATGIASPELMLIGIIAGFIGTNVDSLIGATLENRGVVGNSGTNLLATLTGGIAAMALYHLI